MQQLNHCFAKRDLATQGKLEIGNLEFSSGFTLIELIVVMAILAILTAAVAVLINPVDRINSANDIAVISSISEFGKANDTYFVNHNSYVGGSGYTLDNALADLRAAEESNTSSYSPPSPKYTLKYITTPTTCSTANNDCTGYAFSVSGLLSIKYSSTPVYQWIMGKGCYVTVGITQAELDAGADASPKWSGPGFCP